jgi:opacity protein-like surface antigen
MRQNMRHWAIVCAVVFLLSALPRCLGAGGFKACLSLQYRSISDTVYEETYGSVPLQYGLCLSVEALRRVEIGLGVGYWRDSGRMTVKGEAITFTMVPLSLTVRYRFLEMRKGKISLYVGGGLGYYLYKEDLPSRLEDVSSSDWEYRLEAGCYFYITDRIFLDVRVGYADLKLFPLDEIVNLSGIQTGVGVGYRF